MERYGLLSAGRKVLDYGSSNLYTATAEEVAAFVRRHNPRPRADLDTWAERFAAGSLADASGSALNQSFVGEMFEEAGMGYDAIDIAVGYKTTVVDLNTSRLPENMVGAYDTVLNFGTSEHILNQMNVFATIHAATKEGGLIMHSVPSVGFVDHGYYCYTSRFFFDLAGYNQYEVVDMWFDGPVSNENIFASARQYQSYFPALTKRLELIGQVERETVLDRTGIPVIALQIVYRKQKNVPFMGTVETSTSVGSVPAEVLGSYNR
ncbi:class I SAM-dependent methyltransferase [Phreatobacter stygius]|uniref:Class I SAM-dependent methyltransferase n=1 Tax=Phreatobacter stygius TaxID=1940610 RepID=A0A4D7AU54_9HYPH|nr:class I SAM-dependent methyltransferase [Phreatobacter stygius]QCI63175.1 class I SAM-dependent methyltransferase [Phreatobacter stygius]